jgi:hypothetical protein
VTLTAPLKPFCALTDIVTGEVAVPTSAETDDGETERLKSEVTREGGLPPQAMRVSTAADKTKKDWARIHSRISDRGLKAIIYDRPGMHSSLGSFREAMLPTVLTKICRLSFIQRPGSSLKGTMPRSLFLVASLA